MALRVWLPLLGNFKNHGAANIPAISLVSGNSWASSGKIGSQSLQITKQQSILGISSCMTGKKQMSYAFWVKVNTAWSAQWLDGIAWYSTDGSNAAYSRQEFYTNCTRVGTWFSGSSLSGYVFTPGEWTHLAGTFDYTGGVAKFYINGVLQGTSTALSKTHSCRGDFYIGDSGIDIVENDVRIYDHCLSQAEIKELARGLILHYPLNRQGWGQENLVWDTHWDEISTKWSGWGSPPVREIVNTFGKKYLHVKSSDRWQGYSQNQTKRNGVGEITAGEKLTLSCWAYSNTTLTSYPCIGIHWTDGSSIIAQSWPLLTITTTPQKFITVLTVPNGVSAFNIMVGNGSGTVSGVYEIWVADVKIERGEKSTPWCPNSSDALATTMGLNSTTEYDCSGFCNNGTRTGTFTWTSDTPKYNVSTVFNGSSCIDTNINYLGNEWSYGGWIYSATSSRSWEGVLMLNGTNPADADLQFGFYTCPKSNIIQNSANGKYNSSISWAYGAWHHFMGTYDGATLKTYIDGVLVNSTGITQAFLERHNFVIGARHSSGTNHDCYFLGNISDVRIYATALSADDVKSLYQNEAFIDSSGTIYGQIR